MNLKITPIFSKTSIQKDIDAIMKAALKVTLITVAGMEYASYVEAKGFDVITGSTLGTYTKMESVWKNVNDAIQHVR